VQRADPLLIISALMKNVLIRRDIVHRNGRTKIGEHIDIQLDHVADLAGAVQTLAGSIDERLNPTPEFPPALPLDLGDVPL